MYNSTECEHIEGNDRFYFYILFQFRLFQFIHFHCFKLKKATKQTKSRKTGQIQVKTRKKYKKWVGNFKG